MGVKDMEKAVVAHPPEANHRTGDMKFADTPGAGTISNRAGHSMSSK